METPSHADKVRRLEALRAEAAQLESELAGETAAAAPHWPPTNYYTAYYATAGFMLGIFGAATSLIFNIVGSLMVGQYPLELIRIYLTFPLGARALNDATDSGVVLAIGCCLYLGAGMLLGIPFHLALTWFARQGGLAKRMVVASVLAIVVWLVSYYGILAWLQPLLFGGNWIVSMIPWWVAALTHLVFGWTMAIAYPLGLFEPYRPRTERT
jgi:hypothetical protein